jgi:hypothetical protein
MEATGLKAKGNRDAIENTNQRTDSEAMILVRPPARCALRSQLDSHASPSCQP